MTVWYLYLIECRNARLYTGITPDLGARFEAHCAGKGALFTRLNPPQRMLAARPFEGRSAAARAEIQMKGLTPGQKRFVALKWPIQDGLPAIDSSANSTRSTSSGRNARRSASASPSSACSTGITLPQVSPRSQSS